MRWLLVVVLVFAPHAVRADDTDDVDAAGDVSPARRAAAVALAVVPGFVLHGTGSWIVREKKPAKTLVEVELVGLAGIAAGGLLVGGTGGNPYTIWPGVPILLAGSGLFFTSWATDIWVAAGGSRIEAASRALAPWSVEAGTTWQHDAYRNRALLRGGGHLELGRVRVGALALIDAGGAAKLGEGDVRVRIFGAPATGEVIGDGSRLLARVGGRVHRDDDDEMTQIVGELEVIGRLDLARLDAAFAPSFVEASTGVGVARVAYERMETEIASELLGTFGWGVYLGTRGEAMLFYDHRRDGLVGGLPAWRASGFVGSLGARADVRVYGPWALHAELGVGNAWVSTLAIAYRGGAQ